MNSRPQDGSIASIVVISILSVMLLAALFFGFQSYQKQQDYKQNADKIAQEAVAAAEKRLSEKLRLEFQEESKKPHKTYRGPVSFGSVTFNYPKSWSAYVDESSSSQPLDGYFHPDSVPAIDGGAALALRVELIDQAYSEIVAEYESAIAEGRLKAVAYIPPKLVKAANVQPGIRLSGNLGDADSVKNGSLVIVQVRDKTLKVSTESLQFMDDFNKTVLSSLAFSP